MKSLILVLALAVTLCNASPAFSGFGGYPYIGGFGGGQVIAVAQAQPVYEIHHIIREKAAPKPAPEPAAPAPAQEPAPQPENNNGGQQQAYGPPGHQSGSYAAPAATGGPY